LEQPGATSADDARLAGLPIVAVHGIYDRVLTIAEGRNREVRRICEALELVVERLVRVR